VSVLQEGGANYRVVQRLDDGSVRINAALGDFQFTIRTTACRQGECVGAHVFHVVESPVSAEVMNRFDTEQSFISAGVLDDGHGWIARYFISDYGIPRGNIISNISNFTYISQYFLQETAAQASTISFEGEAAHTAAEKLNTLQARKVFARPVAFFPEYRTIRHAGESGAEFAGAGRAIETINERPFDERFDKLRHKR
ncbi:MAG: YbjN domain-containing protein, partial [Pseudomonadota bacterium]